MWEGGELGGLNVLLEAHWSKVFIIGPFEKVRMLWYDV